MILLRKFSDEELRQNQLINEEYEKSREDLNRLFRRYSINGDKRALRAYNRGLKELFPGVPDIEYVPVKKYNTLGTLLKGISGLAALVTLYTLGEDVFSIDDTLRPLIYAGIGAFTIWNFGTYLLESANDKKVDQLCKDLPSMYPPANSGFKYLVKKDSKGEDSAK